MRLETIDLELKHRFILKKIRDFCSDELTPFPTILCERDDPRILDLVRQFCLFANTMIPYKGKENLASILEGLDIQKGKTDFGDLYIWVSHN